MRMPELLGKAKLGKGNDYPHDIITKPPTPEFEAAHERVFGKREPAWMRKAETVEEEIVREWKESGLTAIDFVVNNDFLGLRNAESPFPVSVGGSSMPRPL